MNRKLIKNKIRVLLFLFCVASCTTVHQQETAVSSQIDVGIALYSFKLHPFSDALNMAADSAKVDYVEGLASFNLGADFDHQRMGFVTNKTDVERVKSMLDKKGLKMISASLGGSNEEDWVRVFNLANEYGLKYLVCEPKPEHWDFIDSLAGVYHVDIAIHEHFKGASRYWHPDSVLAAIKGHKHFYACADLGHWARSGLNVVESLRKLEGHIVELHLKDVAEFGKINTADVNMGEGVIDWPAVVKELKRQKFDGVAYIECEHNFENNLMDVIKQKKYFQDLWNRLN